MTGTSGLWLADEALYQALRERVRAGDAAVMPDAARLRRRAERLLHDPAPAVTDKPFTPHSPSRDPRDYVSIGTYWWPDPGLAGGVPYERRDGRLSPDVALYDRPRWDRAAEGMVLAIKAAGFLAELRFAEEAVRRLRRWFLDPETGMHPHLAHAQMIPGRCSGGPAGVIDFGLYLPVLLDHVGWLARWEQTPWTAADQDAMAAWCGRLLEWLEHHPFGLAEEACGNNHAVYYDRLVAALALFLNRPDRARAQLARTRERIGQQIEPDGRMPDELRRTCSFGYTLMNARGFVDLAWLGRRLGRDLWSWSGEGGRRIPAAVEFVHRLACSPDPWPYPQCEPIDWRMLWPVLEKAGALAGRPYAFAGVAHRMPPGFVPGAFAMVEPLHPFGQPRMPPLV